MLSNVFFDTIVSSFLRLPIINLSLIFIHALRHEFLSYHCIQADYFRRKSLFVLFAHYSFYKCCIHMNGLFINYHIVHPFTCLRYFLTDSPNFNTYQNYSADINLFKIDNRNTKKRGEICSKLIMKTPDRRY